MERTPGRSEARGRDLKWSHNAHWPVTKYYGVTVWHQFTPFKVGVYANQTASARDTGKPDSLSQGYGQTRQPQPGIRANQTASARDTGKPDSLSQGYGQTRQPQPETRANQTASARDTGKPDSLSQGYGQTRQPQPETRANHTASARDTGKPDSLNKRYMYTDANQMQPLAQLVTLAVQLTCSWYTAVGSGDHSTKINIHIKTYLVYTCIYMYMYMHEVSEN